MEDSLLALIPVILMVIFLLMYFCKYAKILEKCFKFKFINCLKQRNENRRDSRGISSNNRFLRREFANSQARRFTSQQEQDEAFILLKGQITRMVLAECEAMRLAKTLFEDNDFTARECIASLRSDLFPNLSVNSSQGATMEYEINHDHELIINRETLALASQLQKTLEQPPSYEDCV